MTTPIAVPPAAPGSRYPRMSYEAFLALPDERHMEWIDGVVIDMAEISELHSTVAGYLYRLVSSYAEHHSLGRVHYDPFNMKLSGRPSGRSPDILFVAKEHLDWLRENHLDGPADLVIEIVSPSSAGVDRGDKFNEYEAGGVPEYWIIDPVRETADFYRLNERGVYQPVLPVDGVYASAMLPGFDLRVEWLWQRPRLREVERALGID